MKLPNIGIKNSDFSRENMEKWIAEKITLFNVVESNNIRALFMPVANSEMCSLMVVQTIKQLTRFDRYKRIVIIGSACSKAATGIYLPNSNETFRNEITEFSMMLEPEIENTIKEFDLDVRIWNVSTDFIEQCDLAYNLPIIAEMTAEYMLPIIPITYSRAEKADLLKIVDLLVRNDSLIILCGGLSHSLSIQESKSLDSETISKVIALDSSIRNIQSSCYEALNSIVQLAENHYWRPRLISYQTTGSKYNIKNTAGYASVVFFNQ
jgi:AmmeMemoRadiSam system protein B